MWKKIGGGLLGALMLTLFATSAFAQTSTIRGTVRLDTNSDGICADGAPVEGITVNFKNETGTEDLYLQSGQDGTYGLVEVGYSNWTVTIQPNADWTATSAKSATASVWPETMAVTGIDFCVVKTADYKKTASTVLPQSGAALGGAVPFWIAMLFGAGLIVSGTGLELRRRRQ
jgi:hypothetical protein